MECKTEHSHCQYKGCWKDFMCFRKMLTPWLIEILFWIGLIFIVITCIWNLFQGEFWNALWTVIIAPIFLRIFCEIFILFFKMHETLSEARDLAYQHVEIANKLLKRSRHKKPHHNRPNAPTDVIPPIE